MTITVFLRGGLGNQLFQYSTGLFCATQLGHELAIRGDLLPLTPDHVGGISRWPAQITEFDHSGTFLLRAPQPHGRTNFFSKIMQVMRMLGDRAPTLTARLGWYANETSQTKSPLAVKRLRIINSYAANKEFAVANRSRLREEVAKLHSPSNAFVSHLRHLDPARTCVVHVRLGDYLGLQPVYGTLGNKYFTDAVRAMKRSLGNLETWVFTDSPELLSSDLVDGLRPSKVIGPDEGLSPLETVILMGQGGAFIASNSSFSWWAAFLGNSSLRVTAPMISDARSNNFGAFDSRTFGWNIVEI